MKKIRKIMKDVHYFHNYAFIVNNMTAIKILQSATACDKKTTQGECNTFLICLHIQATVASAGMASNA